METATTTNAPRLRWASIALPSRSPVANPSPSASDASTRTATRSPRPTTQAPLSAQSERDDSAVRAAASTAAGAPTSLPRLTVKPTRSGESSPRADSDTASISTIPFGPGGATSRPRLIPRPLFPGETFSQSSEPRARYHPTGPLTQPVQGRAPTIRSQHASVVAGSYLSAPSSVADGAAGESVKPPRYRRVAKPTPLLARIATGHDLCRLREGELRASDPEFQPRTLLDVQRRLERRPALRPSLRQELEPAVGGEGSCPSRDGAGYTLPAIRERRAARAAQFPVPENVARETLMERRFLSDGGAGWVDAPVRVGGAIRGTRRVEWGSAVAVAEVKEEKEKKGGKKEGGWKKGFGAFLGRVKGPSSSTPTPSPPSPSTPAPLPSPPLAARQPQVAGKTPPPRLAYHTVRPTVRPSRRPALPETRPPPPPQRSSLLFPTQQTGPAQHLPLRTLQARAALQRIREEGDGGDEQRQTQPSDEDVAFCADAPLTVRGHPTLEDSYLSVDGGAMEGEYDSSPMMLAAASGLRLAGIHEEGEVGEEDGRGERFEEWDRFDFEKNPPSLRFGGRGGMEEAGMGAEAEIGESPSSSSLTPPSSSSPASSGEGIAGQETQAESVEVVRRAGRARLSGLKSLEWEGVESEDEEEEEEEEESFEEFLRGKLALL